MPEAARQLGCAEREPVRKLEIRLFGRFSVRVNDTRRPLAFERAPAIPLLILLLVRGEEGVEDGDVPYVEFERERLAEDLAPLVGGSGDRSAMDQTVHALRSALGCYPASGDSTVGLQALAAFRGRQRAGSPLRLYLPPAHARVDLLEFRAAVQVAIDHQDPEASAVASDSFRGPLLPDEAATLLRELPLETRRVVEVERRWCARKFVEACEAMARRALDRDDAEMLRDGVDCLVKATRAAHMGPYGPVAGGAVETLAEAGEWLEALREYGKWRGGFEAYLQNDLPSPGPRVHDPRFLKRLREVSGELPPAEVLLGRLRQHARLASASPLPPAGRSSPESSAEAPGPAVPEAILTFLFTDIEGSTRLWEQDRPGMRAALAEHDRLLHHAIGSHGGRVFQEIGDAFCAVFTAAEDALAAAVIAQVALRRTELAAAGSQPILRVRMGVHTGVAFPVGTDFRGPALNRTARLMDAAHAGQILLSLAAAEHARDHLPPDVSLKELGSYWLRGFDRRQPVLQVLHPELQPDFPQPRGLERGRRILPVRPESLAGRRQEVARMMALLGTGHGEPQPALHLATSPTRLLTITGAPGVGKSWCAAEVAWQCAETFPGGVCWLGVEEPCSGEGLVERLAQRLDVAAEETATGALLPALREGRQLLVLDGLEQVAGAREVVRELLAGAPELAVLATSRVRLGLASERVLELEPLPPEMAEALFRARARAKGARTVDDAAPGDVAGLCRLLEGLPLAIELAAARARARSPRELAARVAQSLDYLSASGEDLPPQHRALRVALDGSYALLDPSLRALLARLSVFGGALSVDDVEAVCGPAGSEEGVALLRDHSLLLAAGEGARGEARFRMLRVVQEYAAERLAELSRERASGGEPPSVRGRNAWTEIPSEEADRERHARYYLSKLQELAGHLDGPGEADAVQMLDLDLASVRAAWAWVGQANRDELAARLALAGGELLRRRGLWLEWLTWLKQGLAAAEACPALSPAERARLGWALGSAHLDRGELEHALPLLASARDAFAGLGDPAGEADCLNRLGALALRRNRLEEARAHFEATLQRRRDLGDGAGEAAALNNLGVVAQEQEDLEAARRWFAESLAIDRQRRNSSGIAHQLNNLGRLALDRGKQSEDLATRAAALAEAERRLSECRALGERLGDRHVLAAAMNNLGDVRRHEGDREAARPLLREALAIRRDLGAGQEMAESLLSLGALLAGEERWPEATRLLAAAEGAFLAAGSPFVEHAQVELRRVEEALGPEAFARLRREIGEPSLADVMVEALGL